MPVKQLRQYYESFCCQSSCTLVWDENTEEQEMVRRDCTACSKNYPTSLMILFRKASGTEDPSTAMYDEHGSIIHQEN